MFYIMTTVVQLCKTCSTSWPQQYNCTRHVLHHDHRHSTVQDMFYIMTTVVILYEICTDIILPVKSNITATTTVTTLYYSLETEWCKHICFSLPICSETNMAAHPWYNCMLNNHSIKKVWNTMILLFPKENQHRNLTL